MPSDAKPTEPHGSFSATRVLGSRFADADVTSRSPAPTVPETATDSSETGTTSTTSGTLRRLSAVDFLRQLANFVEGPKKYLVIAATVTAVLVAAYLLFGGGGKKPSTAKSSAPIEVHITTNPPDAVVTSGSQPVLNGIVSVVPGDTVTVVVARLGYKNEAAGR